MKLHIVFLFSICLLGVSLSAMEQEKIIRDLKKDVLLLMQVVKAQREIIEMLRGSKIGESGTSESLQGQCIEKFFYIKTPNKGD